MSIDDPTDDERAAQVETIKEAERRRQDNEDLKFVMGHPQGRRVIARILDATGVNASSFNHSSAVMAHNEGKRAVGILMTDWLLDASPTGYFKLLREYMKG